MRPNSWWLPNDAWVRWALVPAVAFMALAGDRAYLVDFWHHLARGRAMVAKGGLVDHDLFTFTIPGQTFLDVNWLTQLLYYWLFETGGLGLVRTVNAFLVAGTLTWLVAICRRRSSSLLWSCLVGAGVFLGLWQVLTIRPQTFSLLFFVALLDILDRSRTNARWLVGPPVIMALWTNMHGAFPAGLILIGCFLVASSVRALRGAPQQPAGAAPHATVRPYVLCLAASVLATLANPYGWNIYLYVGNTSNRAKARRIDEWIPPTFDQAIGAAFFISLVVIVILLIVAWRRGTRIAAWDWCLLACFLPLAAGSIRMVAWWLIILAPMTAWLLATLWPREETRTQTAGIGAGVCFVLLVLAAVFSVPGLNHLNPLLALKSWPVTEKDLDAIRDELVSRRGTGNVFTRLEWGEYLGWAYAPDFKVFMDGRIEIFPDDVWNAYSRVTRGEDDWQKILDAYQVDVLILDASYHDRLGLLPRVDASDWQLVRRQGDALLYLRQDMSARPMLK